SRTRLSSSVFCVNGSPLWPPSARVSSRSGGSSHANVFSVEKSVAESKSVRTRTSAHASAAAEASATSITAPGRIAHLLRLPPTRLRSSAGPRQRESGCGNSGTVRAMRPSPAIALLLLALLACGDPLPPAALRAIPAELPVAARESQRRLPLDGAANLRDLGGYRTRDGHALRWGMLYRSDALADLSRDDVAYLARLRRRRVVDFRSAAEREREPDRLPDGVPDIWQAISGPGLDPAELRDRLLAGKVSAEQAASWLVAGNRAFARDFREVYA